MVKEFAAAGNEEKKAVFARIQEEAEKLTGSSARYSMGVSLWLSGFYILLGFKKQSPHHKKKKKKKRKERKAKSIIGGYHRLYDKIRSYKPWLCQVPILY